jgi:hypothetical protein
MAMVCIDPDVVYLARIEKEACARLVENKIGYYSVVLISPDPEVHSGLKEPANRLIATSNLVGNHY